jgi:AhpD family alkylhydroperoxidase
VPEGAKATFDEIAEGWGMMPNVVAVTAESPALLNGYWRLEAAIDEQTRLDRTEREIVQMAANVENGCTYCMAAHSVAAKMDGVPDDVISAMREIRRLGDAKLDALRDLSRDMVASRGWPEQDDLDAFLPPATTRASCSSWSPRSPSRP